MTVRDRKRVLVVDDSVSSRAYLAEVLGDLGYDVVGRAMDGAMALRLALELEPDAITCDLEMPRMDGFTFIRLLQARKPIPVLVVTTDTRPQAALRALELGASDFIVKPEGRSDELKTFPQRLQEKMNTLTNRGISDDWEAYPEIQLPKSREVIAIGASTGGPRALRDILGVLDTPPRCPVLIAQHMPVGFTHAFAERVRRITGLDFREAIEGELLGPGMIRIAPGGRQLEVNDTKRGCVTSIRARAADERYAPSVDLLFSSVAEVFGDKAMGVVLTGMGKDGAEGADRLDSVNAPVWVESPMTALIDGMPNAVASKVASAVAIPIDRMAFLLARILNDESAK